MQKLFITIVLWIFSVGTAWSQSKVPSEYQELYNKIVNIAPKQANYPQSTTSKLMEFASSMIGIPYKYASRNPDIGFDCSGFVSYVFGSFGFKVPRSSMEFSKTGVPVNLANAKIGDILLFTGTNPKIRKIGHIGIVYSKNNGEIVFIHSSSGKSNGVTLTKFDDHYKNRFIKVVSLL